MRRKICERCDMPFLTAKGNAKYCPACRKAAYVEKSGECRRSDKRRKPTSTTDWEGISRICKEHGVSYGQAVAMGLLQKEWHT